MSDNVDVTNNQEDLLFGVATLFNAVPQRDQTQDINLSLGASGWSTVSANSNQDELQLSLNVPNLGPAMPQRDQTQDINLSLGASGWSMVSANSNQDNLQLPLNVSNLGPALPQRDQTQDINLHFRVGDSSTVSANSNQDDLQLPLNVPNLGPAMPQRDQTQDINLSLGASGWSTVAANSNQDDLQLPLNVSNLGLALPQRDQTQDINLRFRVDDSSAVSAYSIQDVLQLPLTVPSLGPAMAQRDQTQDLKLRVCNCGWSQVATYRDLKNHQADMGCAPGPEVNQSDQQDSSQNLALTNSQEGPRLRGNNPTLGAADTASAQAPPSEALSMEQQLTCSICMNLFVDPVTTACGHSFCKGCLDQHCQSNERLCPLCKQIVRRMPEINIILRSIAEEMMKNQQRAEVETSLAPGDVACDICAEPKLKAEKSCLVCLASYCLNHLKNHSSTKRLKGHKLVEPVENLDERACLEHGRPLELYSRKTEKCICARCLEEGQEEVVSTEDEWNSKKTKLQNTKVDLQEEIKKRKKRVVELDESLKSCKDKLDNEWWDIDAVFTTVINIMEEAHARALKPLTERRDVLEKDAKEIKDELEAEIDRLEKTISVLDDISALEDHVLFLQRYPSLQDQEDHKDSTKVELDTSLSFGTMRKTTTAMLEQIQLELERLAPTELQRLPKFTVDVKLDPTTAHRRLVLSDDGTEVKDGGDDQEVDDSPERFDLFASILGINRLTSGRSYWEVEVSNKSGWDLGVTTGDANRKGKLTLNPDNGYWVTVHYEDDNYAAMTAPPARLSLKKKPQKVGVFVDYKEGLVSFYDVRAQTHIFSFTNCSFGDDLLPYFSPHAQKDEENAEPLIISAVDHQEMS